MNWFQKVSGDYLYDDPTHDYEITWDHEPDEEVPQDILGLIGRFQQELNSSLIPKLGIFRSFKVEFVNSLNPDTIALYIAGTYSSPVVAIDLGNTQIACEEEGQDCGVAVMMSILHELAHAIQEAQGKPFDEDKAEEFAVNYHYYREISEV